MVAIILYKTINQIQSVKLSKIFCAYYNSFQDLICVNLKCNYILTQQSVIYCQVIKLAYSIKPIIYLRMLPCELFCNGR